MKIKLLRSESMLTSTGRLDFKAGQVTDVEPWIAASLMGRGYAIEADPNQKAEVKGKGAPPKEPFERLPNDVSQAPVAKADDPRPSDEGEPAQVSEKPKKGGGKK